MGAAEGVGVVPGIVEVGVVVADERKSEWGPWTLDTEGLGCGSPLGVALGLTVQIMSSGSGRVGLA